MARIVTVNRAHLGEPYINDLGFMHFGAGNPDTGYTTVFNNKRPYDEVGIKAIYRQGEDIEGVYDPKKKIVSFDVPDGFQVVDLDHGVSVANPARSAFNVNWSFGEFCNGLNPKKLSMKIDIDAREGKTKYLELKAVRDEDGNLDFIDRKTKTVVVNNAGESPEGATAADSFNFAFVKEAIDTRMAAVYRDADYDWKPTAGDQFDWIMRNDTVQLHAQFNLFDNPADDYLL